MSVRYIARTSELFGIDPETKTCEIGLFSSMTSFIIKAQASRPVPEVWGKDGECAFCQIIHHDARAFRIYEDDHVIAFLGKLLHLFIGRAIFLLSH